MRLIIPLLLVTQLMIFGNPPTIYNDRDSNHPEQEIYYEICIIYGDQIKEVYLVPYKHIDHDQDFYLKVFWDGKWVRLRQRVLMKRVPEYGGPPLHRIFR